MQNYVAKHAHKYNRSQTYKDRTKYTRKLNSGNDLYDYWEEYLEKDNYELSESTETI